MDTEETPSVNMNSTEQSTDKRLANLKPPWKKGDPSPNPSGKPKGQRSYATIYREALEKLAEMEGETPEEMENFILRSGLKNALTDYRFYKDMNDRLHGPPKQDIGLGGVDGGPITIKVVYE